MRGVRIVGETPNVSLSYVSFMQILVYGRCYKKVKCGRVLLNETYKFYVVEVYNAVDSQER